MEHQKAGSQYITGCASMGGLGVRRDIPSKLNLANLNAWMGSCSYKIMFNNFNSYIYIYIYTGCPRRNVPDFRRMFLKLKYTDITQNTYIQSWTVTEIMAREVWKYDSYYTLIDYQIRIKTGRNMWFL